MLIFMLNTYVVLALVRHWLKVNVVHRAEDEPSILS